MLDFFSNIGDFALGILIIVAIATVIAIPSYGVYRLFRMGLHQTKILSAFGYFSGSCGVLGMGSALVYWVPMHKYMDGLIFLLVGLLAFNVCLFLTQKINLAMYAIRSRLHLINCVVAASVYLSTLIYIFIAAYMDESIWQFKPLLLLWSVLVILYLGLWLKNIIYFGFLRELNDNFFAFKPEMLSLANKTLYPIVIPTSIDKEKTKEYFDTAFKKAQEGVDEAIEQYTVLKFTPSKKGIHIQFTYLLTNAPVKMEDPADISGKKAEDVQSVLMPKSAYATVEYQGSLQQLNDYLKIFYIWLSLTRVWPMGNKEMLLLWLNGEEDRHVNVRVYCSVRGIYALSL